jgi:hypothetical protein
LVVARDIYVSNDMGFAAQATTKLHHAITVSH